MMKKSLPKNAEPGAGSASAAELIDARIEELGDWRGELLALVKEALPEVVGKR